MVENTSVNSGAIHALRGYRSQFLYSLFRILFSQESEYYFNLEGNYEDLDIYGKEGEVREIIQIKDVKDLTLSSLLDSRETSFLKRAVRKYTNDTPSIHLVSFRKISPEIEELATTVYSPKLIQKLKKYGLKENEIDRLKSGFKCTVLSKDEIEKQVKGKISDLKLFADLDVTMDLFLFWMYLCAEKQEKIDRQKVIAKFSGVANYLSQRLHFTRHVGTLIRPLDEYGKNLNIEKLKNDFYQGISATYHHILADADVIREKKLRELHSKFILSDITFIHGASGQGKSTLAYRYLKDYCTEVVSFQIFLTEDIGLIFEIITALEGIAAGMLVPVVVYLDVTPGSRTWVNLLQILSAKNNLKFLVTIREEDWRAVFVRDKFEFSEVEMEFDEEEGRMVYEALNIREKVLRFIDFDEAWKQFGEKGPLLEFVYLITQYQALPEKLKEQITRLQERAFNDEIAKLELKLLRYVCVADSNGAIIDYQAIAKHLECEEIGLVVSRLTNEYLLQLTEDRKYVVGLHPVRSAILQDILFDEEIILKSNYAIGLFGLIKEDTYAEYIRKICRYLQIDIHKILSCIQKLELSSWPGYAAVTEALLWKGVDDYACVNREVFQQLYDKFRLGWKLFFHFDFSEILQGKSIVENSGLFPPEAVDLSKQMNASLTDKATVFHYLLDWHKMLTEINLRPETVRDWEAYFTFYFWLLFLQENAVHIHSVDYKRVFREMPLELGAKILYILKKGKSVKRKLISLYEEWWKERIILEYNVFYFEVNQKDKSVKVHYLYDITGENSYGTEENRLHAKSVFLLHLMRYAFDEMEVFASQGYGHKFSFIPDDYDDSLKNVSRKNLPLQPLLNLNVLLINTVEYAYRPVSWSEYVDFVMQERENVVEILNLLTTAFARFYHQNDYTVLLQYLQTYEDKYRNEFSKGEEPFYPKLISDEWGYIAESNIKEKEKYSIQIENYILSFEKYQKYRKLYQGYQNAVRNFINQSAEVILKRLQEKAGNKVEDYSQTIRVSLVMNLFDAYKTVTDFQREFRRFFAKYVLESKLKNTELQEIRNIGSLCYIWQQFCYGGNLLKGDIIRLAQQRLIDSKRAFENRMTKEIKSLEKEEGLKISIRFEEDLKKVFFLVDSESYVQAWLLLEKFYTLLSRVIDKPEVTTLKYLILETYYPDFCIIFLVNGRAPQLKMFEFPLYKLMDKSFEQLRKMDFIAQDLSPDIQKQLNIASWEKETAESESLNRMLSAAGMSPLIASGLKQLFELSGKEVEDSGVQVIKKQVNKLGELFKQSLQSAWDCLRFYTPVILANGLMTEPELNEMFDLFSPSSEESQQLFSGQLILNTEVMERWLPKLEDLNNRVGILYIYLFDILIRG